MNIKATKNPHYVNNKEFHEALVLHKKKVDIAKEKNAPPPMISNYLGDCFLKIATHLSYRPNFVNYMFREDMISDGVENCVNYINNFDTERTNPFAYFTQIVYYAFLRRIHKEKKQMEIKEKIIERSGYDEVFTVDRDEYNYSEYNSIKDNIQTKLYQ
jgi:hypothetical protein